MREKAGIIVVGGRGQGKTTLCLRLAAKSLATDPANNFLLVVSTKQPNSDRVWKKAHRIPVDVDGNWDVSGVKRGGAPALMLAVCPDLGLDSKYSANVFDQLARPGAPFRNGTVIWDDCGDYESGNLSRPFRRMMRGMRQYGLDMYFSYHQIGEIPPKMFGMCNLVVQFRTTERVEIAERKTPGYERLLANQRDLIGMKRGQYRVTVLDGSVFESF